MKQATKKTRITRDLLIDALVWHCPNYVRNGAFAYCENLDGTRTNCVKQQCSYVSDIFRTMQQIANNEITVF